MIVKKLKDVHQVDLEGYNNVTKQIVLGPEDGSSELILRLFTLGEGGSSPYHVHDFPHLVRIESGTGVAVDEQGNETPLETGDYIYVHDQEKHCFRNTGSGQFAFICIVPSRGEGNAATSCLLKEE